MVGLLAALYARESTGQGDYVEISMVDATLGANDGLHAALENIAVGVTNEVHETAAGLLMMAGEFRYIWKLLSTVMGVTDGLGDDATLEEKISARRAASKRFFTETCRNRQEVIDALDKMNIAWGDVRPAAEVTDLACVKARQSIKEVPDRQGGMRPVPDSPYRFRHLESGVRRGAPHLGEHNNEVLADWLGWSAEEISSKADVLKTNEDLP